MILPMRCPSCTGASPAPPIDISAGSHQRPTASNRFFMPIINVNLPGRSYEIVIEPGLLDDIGDRTRAAAPHRTAMLVMDRAIAEPHGRRGADSLDRAGYHIGACELDADERKKSLASVRTLYDAMLRLPLERSSPVIAMGGGLIGDVAGFAAATYLRGVPLIHVPTTLLAMVDAAIGGKTAVNIELPDGSLGKNLIGAFWQPRAVLADPTVLATLDERDFRSGMAESIKHAVISSESLLNWLEQNRESIMQQDPDALTELIHRSAMVKVEIVTEDERESGRRALLNLGHTFAHAIEPIRELDLRHGEAVAIGLCAAAFVSRQRDLLTNDALQRIEDALQSFGLPTRLMQPINPERLLAAMHYDKKVADGRLRLILPRTIGAADMVSDVPAEAIIAGWRHVGAG